MSERKINLLILGLILLLGFALRVQHLLHVSPITDEYITMLATRATLRWGYPRLPSGLCYDHGLLFTYSSALFAGVFGFDPMVTRVPGMAFGLLTIATVYRAGRDWFSTRAGLMAATIVSLSPQAITWGARARMYSLWMWLFFLALFWLATGLIVRDTKLLRCLGVVALVSSSLAHILSVAFAFPLAAGLSVGWLICDRKKSLSVRLRDIAWPEAGVALFGVFLLISFRALGGRGISESTMRAMIDKARFADPLIIAVRAAAVASPFFRPPLVIPGLFVTVGIFFMTLRMIRNPESSDILLMCLVVILCGTFIGLGALSSYYADRYVVALFPVFALLAGYEIAFVGHLLGQRTSWLVGLAAPLLLLVGSLGPAACVTATQDSINIDQAYAFVRRNRAPGDIVVTTSPAAATICLGGSDIYISADSDGPCTERRDRWTGIPHYTCSEDFATLLDTEARVWFVVDDWFWDHSLSNELMDLIQIHMDLAFHPDGARVYLHHE